MVFWVVNNLYFVLLVTFLFRLLAMVRIHGALRRVNWDPVATVWLKLFLVVLVEVTAGLHCMKIMNRIFLFLWIMTWLQLLAEISHCLLYLVGFLLCHVGLIWLLLKIGKLFWIHTRNMGFCSYLIFDLFVFNHLILNRQLLNFKVVIWRSKWFVNCLTRGRILRAFSTLRSWFLLFLLLNCTKFRKDLGSRLRLRLHLSVNLRSWLTLWLLTWISWVLSITLDSKRPRLRTSRIADLTVALLIWTQGVTITHI